MQTRFAQLDDPPDSLIRAFSAGYPVEREVDRLLMRKLQRRREPAYRRVSLSELGDRLRALLESHVGCAVQVSDLAWLSGGASKIQVVFTLNWRESDRTCMRRLVLRMDPSESLNTTSRLRELELISAVEGVVPVPRIFCIDEDGRYFPEPALVYSYVRGVTRPSAASTGRISGLGTVFDDPLRGRLAAQFVDHLAMIHTLDVSARTFRSMDLPRIGSNECALWQLNRARRVWDEDRCEDLPLLDVAALWLQENAPPMDRSGVVHGDYRSGNFLFDEGSALITAWLDWERGLIGDRHRDLAWTCQRSLGRPDATGRFLVSGLVPEAEFWDTYEAASGLSVDPVRLHYYGVLNCYQRIVTIAGSARRIVRLAKSHQDILLASIQRLVPELCREMVRLLQKAL
ncbi:MAG: phosphotransferase family protein [Lautropia sp.]